MYFSILPRAPTWYWVSFLDLQFQTERQPSFLLKKGYRFSICYRFHFTSDSPENPPQKKAGHEPAGRHVRRFLLLYCLLSSNILFLISYNSNFMWYTKENHCYDKYDTKWQKDIFFYGNKEIDKKYKGSNNSRWSQKWHHKNNLRFIGVKKVCTWKAKAASKQSGTYSYGAVQQQRSQWYFSTKDCKYTAGNKGCNDP